MKVIGGDPDTVVTNPVKTLLCTAEAPMVGSGDLFQGLTQGLTELGT